MSAEPRPQEDEIKDGVVQLRFADDDGQLRDINAAEFAEVLQGLVEFTSDMAKRGLFGDGMPPEVRVRPPQQGSVIIEAILQWAGDNPELAIAAASTAGGLTTQAINLGFKRLRGDRPRDVEFLGDDMVKIQWSNDTVNVVPMRVWDRLNDMKRPTRTQMRKLMAPLGDDVPILEVRDGAVSESTTELLESAPEAVADRSDYRLAAAETDEVREEVTSFTAEARLQSIDFRRGEKWRVQTLHGTRLATMEDEEFLRELDRGAPLHKDDIFEVTINETKTVKNERTSTEWALVSVTRKRRGGDDGNGAVSSSAEAETP